MGETQAQELKKEQYAEQQAATIEELNHWTKVLSDLVGSIVKSEGEEVLYYMHRTHALLTALNKEALYLNQVQKIMQAQQEASKEGEAEPKILC